MISANVARRVASPCRDSHDCALISFGLHSSNGMLRMDPFLMSRQKLWLAGLMLCPASPAMADRFDDLWSQGHQWLEPAGITKPMFRSLTIWSEGQYFLGYCGGYLPGGDVASWRNWWSKTVVPRSEVGRHLLEKGAALYSRGVDDGRSAPPAKEFCRRVLDDWSQDIDAANVKADAE